MQFPFSKLQILRLQTKRYKPLGYIILQVRAGFWNTNCFKLKSKWMKWLIREVQKVGNTQVKSLKSANYTKIQKKEASNNFKSPMPAETHKCPIDGNTVKTQIHLLKIGAT
jgi:hypothetical protein